ncbi:MAG: DNA polymerase III subunit gamma/tau [Pseudomonadota bacterium]
MSYQVLARKWRPANFQQMVGQEHVLQALSNALDSDRLHHAYLFSGTRGVGKTTVARIFAKSLNCDEGIGSEPCGKCPSCLEIDEGRSVDLIEIDAASRTGVDDMRELLDNVQYAPTRGRFKIYLIDEVHMLSKHSFNALLKTLEEPPSHIKFLLATTDPQKVPVTVLSRCLQFNLKRMSRGQIIAHLKFLTEQESIDADQTALAQLASAADGSMRDALSLLDQAIGYGGGQVRQETVYSMLGSISTDYMKRLFDALVEQQAVAVVQQARAIIENGPDYQRLCAEMINLIQQVALCQADSGLINEDDFDAEWVQTLAGRWSAEEAQLYYQILLQGRQDLLLAPDESSAFEMLMLRLLAFSPQVEIDNQAESLKKKPESGVAPSEEPLAVASPVIAEIPEVSPAETESILTPQDLSEIEQVIGNKDDDQMEAGGPPDPSQVATEKSVQADTQISSPISVNVADSATEIQPETPLSSSISSASNVPFDWADLAYSLELIGLSQQIVANSLVRSYCEEQIELELSSDLFELVNEKIIAEIEQAVNESLGVSLKLRMIASDVDLVGTPVEIKKQRLEQERQAAIELIRDEKVVRKLQQALAVELDESSVEKIESN